jgi:hypothetical protein
MREFPISCSISRFQDRLYTYRKANSQQTIGSTAKIHRKTSFAPIPLVRVLTSAGILRKECNSKKSAAGGSQYEQRDRRENRPQDNEKQTNADATASTFHRSVNIFIIRKRILFRHLAGRCKSQMLDKMQVVSHKCGLHLTYFDSTVCTVAFHDFLLRSRE